MMMVPESTADAFPAPTAAAIHRGVGALTNDGCRTACGLRVPLSGKPLAYVGAKVAWIDASVTCPECLRTLRAARGLK